MHHVSVQSLPAGPELLPVSQPGRRQPCALSALLPPLLALSASLLSDNPSVSHLSVFNFLLTFLLNATC